MNWFLRYGDLVFGSLLALIAAMFTFWQPKAQKYKLIAIGFIVVCLGLMVRIGFKQRWANEAEQRASADALRTAHEKLDHLIKFAEQPPKTPKEIQDLNDQFNRLQAEVKRQGESDVKSSAELLSVEIQKFLADRGSPPRITQKPPPLGLNPWDMKGGWTNIDKVIAFNEETEKQYGEKFSSRVVSMRNRLAERGLTDPILDSIYQRPHFAQIEIVAERLALLSLKSFTS